MIVEFFLFFYLIMFQIKSELNIIFLIREYDQNRHAVSYEQMLFKHVLKRFRILQKFIHGNKINWEAMLHMLNYRQFISKIKTSYRNSARKTFAIKLLMNELLII